MGSFAAKKLKIICAMDTEIGCKYYYNEKFTAHPK